MTRSRRIVWSCAGLAIVAAAAFHVAVRQWTRERPNYSRIEDGLWLGGYVRQPPPGTASVLNLCETEDRYRVPHHRWEPIRDAEPAPTLDWLRQQVAFIDSERRAGRTVYVHCLNGVSRSGMVVAAYLMQREGWTRDRTLEHLRHRRPEVRPNPAFRRLLVEWEATITHPTMKS